MLGWTVAIMTGLAAGIAVGMLVRREKILYSWLREEISGLRADVVMARFDVRAISGDEGQDILDRVEGEDFEIANNLDRMNSLLDQLNGLLKGKSPERTPGSRAVYREDPPAVLDFTSPEELRRFEMLPPISREEIDAIDWEYLFKRIAKEDSD